MYKLYHGDCLKIMPTLPKQSIDAILTDIPYGSTACDWDNVFPFDEMWECIKHVLKPGGVFVTTASQPFTSLLVCSNFNFFRYMWVWDKGIPSGMSYARFQPMRQTEDIVVFYDKTCQYNPQMSKRREPIKSGGNGKSLSAPIAYRSPTFKKEYAEKFPVNLLSFLKIRQGSIHPTQKPVALYKYLVQTYTNPGDTVLDMCMGSGTTGVACIDTDRNFIGIELELKYVQIAKERIEKASLQGHLL